MAPHIALREAGLGFELEKVDLAAKKTEHGTDYLSVNPKGYVPALALDNGRCSRRCRWFCSISLEQAAGSNLALQPGSMDRYRLQEWLGFIATELHKGFGPLWKPNTPDSYKPIVRENLERRFDYLDGQLDGRDYLAGAGLTIADAYCFTILTGPTCTTSISRGGRT
jgi:glutathione S-transferase